MVLNFKLYKPLSFTIVSLPMVEWFICHISVRKIIIESPCSLGEFNANHNTTSFFTVNPSLQIWQNLNHSSYQIHLKNRKHLKLNLQVEWLLEAKLGLEVRGVRNYSLLVFMTKYPLVCTLMWEFLYAVVWYFFKAKGYPLFYRTETVFVYFILAAVGNDSILLYLSFWILAVDSNNIYTVSLSFWCSV